MMYSKRHIARVKIEAETPIFVGSGEHGINTDALIQKDFMGLPIIQGTSIAGVLRHLTKQIHPDTYWNKYFGNNIKDQEVGSSLIIGTAKMMIGNRVIEGTSDYEKVSPYIKKFESLPKRQHVKITEKGVAKNNGLFDNEITYKGIRFCFDIEMVSKEEDDEARFAFAQLLNTLHHPMFRLGSGTRNGYGKIKVFSCEFRTFNLKEANDLEDYINHDHLLNSQLKAFEAYKQEEDNNISTIQYQLKLIADDFMIFGAGYGTDQADAVSCTEEIIHYSNDDIEFVDHFYIPGSSIKGALVHRTLYHLNKNKGHTKEVESIEDSENIIALFGSEGDTKEVSASRGKVIFNDIYLNKDAVQDKVFNHVTIDRFTGGAYDGALFNEAVIQYNDELILDISMDKESIDESLITAFEDALKDLCWGLLPLGGMTNKGHGYFTGKLIKNGTTIIK